MIQPEASKAGAPVNTANVLPPEEAALVSEFLDAEAEARGISRAEAEQRVLLDAAKRWKGTGQMQPQDPPSANDKDSRPMENAAPISPASLTVLLVVTGVLAILAGAIFVLTK